MVCCSTGRTLACDILCSACIDTELNDANSEWYGMSLDPVPPCNTISSADRFSSSRRLVCCQPAQCQCSQRRSWTSFVNRGSCFGDHASWIRTVHARGLSLCTLHPAGHQSVPAVLPLHTLIFVHHMYFLNQTPGNTCLRQQKLEAPHASVVSCHALLFTLRCPGGSHIMVWH